LDLPSTIHFIKTSCPDSKNSDDQHTKKMWIWITDSKKKVQVHRLIEGKRMNLRIVKLVYIPFWLKQHVYIEDPKKLVRSTITVYKKVHIASNQVPLSFLAPEMILYQ
jgi:hypothetical protein